MRAYWFHERKNLGVRSPELVQQLKEVITLLSLVCRALSSYLLIQGHKMAAEPTRENMFSGGRSQRAKELVGYFLAGFAFVLKISRGFCLLLTAWALMYHHIWLQNKLKNGMFWFSSCNSKEVKNKEACERDIVHRIGHRTFSSLPFSLHIFF